ncbi:DNA-3-methyladenine glycosylase family protein [Deinococcus yavapaiensis]|uniref:DNA-3-methyladenine glycosylase II n=1 Tax=Deinococcus yavapaiensis KR-236 TaxID=694435 RepID=A0A318S9D7_9DEIO|nr:DNA-3-methyladenine glycosylase [Deinococcus yavapaiensis]PYE55831.1 DNA-3-methyladenine glycosylase II [Deinococcus yavapaiensis KR-236]
MTPDSTSAATDHLRRDPVFALVIERVGELAPLPPASSPFASLVRSVIGQQVSVKAADAIERRVRELAPNLAPHELAALPHEALRGAGLSNAKVRTVHELAHRTETGVLDIGALEGASEEDVIAALSSIPGIGRWTAEMFLLFALGRPDVFSWGDGGIRRAVKALYGEDAGPEVSEAWRPYRSLASRYLWRFLS